MTQGDATIAGLSDGMCCIGGGTATSVGSWAPGSEGTGERADPRPRNATGPPARVTQALTALRTPSQSVTKQLAASLEIRATTHLSKARGRWAVTSRGGETENRNRWGQEADSPAPLPAFSFLLSFLPGSLSLPTPLLLSFFLTAPLASVHLCTFKSPSSQHP